MRIRRADWLAFPVRLAVAALMVLTVAGAGFSVARAQDDLALPPCSDVFGIGDTAQSCLRVVNAGSPEVGPVDVYVGDAIVAEGIEYGEATEYAAVMSGSQQIRVVPAGTPVDQATVDMTEDLQPGAAYQMTVSGLATEELSSWLSGVDVTALPAGEGRVRVVHASPDLEAIDVSLATGEVPFEGIELGSQSGYVPMDAGAYTFQLRQSGEDTLLLETPEEVQVEEGMLYDIYVIGQSEAGTLNMVIFTADTGVATAGTPAAVATPVAAVGGTPVSVTPVEETPAATPADED